MWNDKPYYSLDYYLRETFGEKVYKIAIDGGMTCPTRDGSLDTRGCIFCSAGGSGEFAAKRTSSIREQLMNGMQLFSDKKTGHKFIAYFQSYTNTYAPISYLEQIFTEAFNVSFVVGISIATRPDCLGEDVLALLARLKAAYPEKFIWVELGLQTIHAKSIAYIRRGYENDCFEQAVRSLHTLDIPVIVHVILGLPDEDTAQYLETIAYLNALPIWGVKLQLLHIIEGTDLARDYQAGRITLPLAEKEDYLDALVQCLAHLRRDIVIHRVTGDGPKDMTLAPLWSKNKRDVLNSLLKLCRTQEKEQGSCFEHFPHH